MKGSALLAISRKQDIHLVHSIWNELDELVHASGVSVAACAAHHVASMLNY